MHNLHKVICSRKICVLNLVLKNHKSMHDILQDKNENQTFLSSPIHTNTVINILTFTEFM